MDEDGGNNGDNENSMTMRIVEDGDDNGPLETPGLRFATLGLIIPEGISFQRWMGIGESLQRVEKAIGWMLGDWLNYGERRYGEMYTQAQDTTHYSESHLGTMKYVASKFPMSKRRANLSFAHHAAVASLMDVAPDIVEEILDMAEEKNLTEKEIRSDARQARVDLGIEPKGVDYPVPILTSQRDHSGTEPADGERESVILANSDKDGPSVKWLDELLMLVMFAAKATEPEDMQEACIRCFEWCRDHDIFGDGPDDA